MKLLILYCEKFSYLATINTIEEYRSEKISDDISKAIVAFIQVEKEDEAEIDKIEKKMTKQLKWAAGKNNTNCVVLHSFAHLSESKAEPHITKYLLDKAQERLLSSQYDACQTPFGYFLDLKIEAPGFPLARLFYSY